MDTAAETTAAITVEAASDGETCHRRLQSLRLAQSFVLVSRQEYDKEYSQSGHGITQRQRIEGYAIPLV